MFFSIVIGFILGCLAGYCYCFFSPSSDESEYTDSDIPKGCRLVQVGDKFGFKIGKEFVDMQGNKNLWSHPEYVYQHCLIRSRNKVLKQGIETYQLLEATK